MKKLNLSLALAVILALVATACSLQVIQNSGPQNPQPGPVGPQQGPHGPQPGPQGPQPGPQGPQPGPQGPQPGPDSPQPGPGGSQPEPQEPQPGPGSTGGSGETQINFTTDRTTLTIGQCAQLQWTVQGGFGVRLNGQTVAQSGQQQVCPTATTTYRLEVDTGNQTLPREVTITVSGGGQSQGSNGWQPTAIATKNNPGGGGKKSPTITPTTPAGIPNVKIIPITIDFQASDLSVDDGHYLHIYIVNNGNTSGNITFAITCKGLYTLTNGGSSSSIAYSTAKVTYDFTKVGARWINSKIKLDKGIGYYNLTCTISPDVMETTTSNNSATKTLTITP